MATYMKKSNTENVWCHADEYHEKVMVTFVYLKLVYGAPGVQNSLHSASPGSNKPILGIQKLP